MPIKVLMPALSPTMTEGTLAKWHIKEGDKVAPGDVIAEIETDKATMEVEAADEGVVGRLVVAEGTAGVPVNAVIAVLLEEGEDDSVLATFDSGSEEAEASPPSGEAPPSQPESAPEGDPGTPSAPPGQGAAPSPAPAAEAKDGARIFASPLARRMAAQAGLDLASITGSGPHGRIVKADVEAALAAKPTVPPVSVQTAETEEAAPAAATAATPTEQPRAFEAEYDLEPLTSMRRTIARRLGESKRTVPHFYLTVDCRIDALLDLRKQLNERAQGRFKLSVNDMVVKAAALALRRVPEANASWSDEGIRRYRSIDISVAVAIEGGLVTPIVRQADSKGLEAISEEIRELVGRAREGRLKPEEYEGGTFSISNLGMYGVREFAAVINPPQACILAVGAGERRPVVEEDALAVATVMTCTLSVDHRAVDGAVAARFLAVFKGLLEDPVTMLL